jgi:hypothetical protein
MAHDVVDDAPRREPPAQLCWPGQHQAGVWERPPQAAQRRDSGEQVAQPERPEHQHRRRLP